MLHASIKSLYNTEEIGGSGEGWGTEKRREREEGKRARQDEGRQRGNPGDGQAGITREKALPANECYMLAASPLGSD